MDFALSQFVSAKVEGRLVVVVDTLHHPTLFLTLFRARATKVYNEAIIGPNAEKETIQPTNIAESERIVSSELGTGGRVFQRSK